MSTAIVTGLIILIAGVVLLFVAHRVLRFALKAALVFALIFILLGGATLGWWQGWFSTSSTFRPATNQQRNANRRPSR